MDSRWAHHFGRQPLIELLENRDGVKGGNVTPDFRRRTLDGDARGK
jgi:hypothetical protein